MGNLITEYEGNGDKRKALGVVIPPPPQQVPAPVPEQPQVSLNQPVVDEQAPTPVDPEVGGYLDAPVESSLETQTVADMPGFQPTGEEPYQAPQETVTPDFAPYQNNKLAVDAFQEQQAQAEQKQFDSMIETDAERFLTSGDTYPTLYEGGTQFDTSKLNENALRLVNKSHEQVKQENVQSTLQPMAGKRQDMTKPNFNSSRNPIYNLPGSIKSALSSIGDTIGITNQSGEFNPGAGFGAYAREVEKNPWKLLTLPVAPIIIAAESQWGEMGDGLFGALMYGISIPENIIMGTSTDIYNVVTGNKNPKKNTPNVAQAVLGGNYDFTQPVSPARPLSFIGSDKAPETLGGLRDRSPLYSILIHPYQWELARKAGILDQKFPKTVTIPGVFGGKETVIPTGRILQVNEAVTGLAADVFKGVVTGFGVGGIKKAFTSGKVVAQVVAGEVTETATAQIARQAATPITELAEIPAAVVKQQPRTPITALEGVVPKMPPTPTAALEPIPTRIYPKLINKPVAGALPGTAPGTQALLPPAPPRVVQVQLSAPAIKRPPGKGGALVPVVNISIKPATVSPKPQGIPVITARQLVPGQGMDEIIKGISEAPPGTLLDVDTLVTVERSAEDLTEVAKLLGDVPPNRTKPLSRNRLDEISKSYPDALNPYKIYGSPIDIPAFQAPIKRVELETGKIAEIDDIGDYAASPIDVPLPKDTRQILPEIKKRQALLAADDTPNDVQQQVAHELDRLVDNLVDTPDVTDPATLAELARSMPRSQQTLSPDGLPKLQDYLTRQTIYEETAKSVEELTPQYLNGVESLSENITEVVKLPGYGRTSAIQAQPFTPSPVPPAQPKSSTDILSSQVLDIVKELDDGSNYLPIFKIRAKYPGVPKEVIDNALYRLEQQGKIELSALVEAAKYTVDEVTQGIQGRAGSPLFFITKTPLAETPTYYHGSQVTDLNLQAIDPLVGGSRNELGIGVYLTRSQAYADDAAKAMPQRNLPPVAGRNFDEVGSVYQVTPDVRKPILAAQVPPDDVKQAFVEAIQKTQPEEVAKAFEKSVVNSLEPFRNYYTKLDEIIESKVGLNELDSLQTQRVIGDSLRVRGYDAIDDGDVLVLLNNATVESSVKLGNVGTGEMLEGYAARFNVAQRTAQQFPGNKVLEVQAKEAGTQVQTELARKVGGQLEEATDRAEDAATAFARSQDELEDFIKQERVAKQEISAKAADNFNANQIKNDAMPDKNHCI